MKPVVSVILPLYRSEHIAWLSLESLCRQQEIDFKWELVIAEENGLDFHEFGLNKILEYQERLKKVGCVKITYLKLYEWIALSLKYHLLIQKCSESSELVIIQQGDYYSSPFRFALTYKHFLKGADWIHGDSMILWNALKDENYIIGKHKNSKKFWMAFRMNLAKKIPQIWKWKYLDQFLWDSVSNTLNGKVNKVSFDLYDGLVVHGFNSISAKSDSRWKHYSLDLHSIIPNEIAEKLKKQKDKSKNWDIQIKHIKTKMIKPSYEESVYE